MEKDGKNKLKLRSERFFRYKRRVLNVMTVDGKEKVLGKVPPHVSITINQNRKINRVR